MLVIIDKVPVTPKRHKAGIAAAVKELGGKIEKIEQANGFYTITARLPDDAEIPDTWKKTPDAKSGKT